MFIFGAFDVVGIWKFVDFVLYNWSRVFAVMELKLQYVLFNIKNGLSCSESHLMWSIVIVIRCLLWSILKVPFTNGYYHHYVIIIPFNLIQSDHIKRLQLFKTRLVCYKALGHFYSNCNNQNLYIDFYCFNICILLKKSYACTNL